MRKPLTEEQKERIKHRNKIYHEKNKEILKLKRKPLTEEQKEKARKRSKEYYNKNKKNVCLKNKVYVEKNKEKISVYQKEHRKNNREKNVEYLAEYYKNNKKELLVKQSVYQRKNKYKRNINTKIRKKKDNVFRITTNVRSYISSSIRKNKFFKNSKLNDILGCTVEFYVDYLTSQFEPWMNWENYGNPKDGVIEPNKTWDIDHIIPLSSAKTEEELILLFKYTNTKPLCSYTNRVIKRNTIFS